MAEAQTELLQSAFTVDGTEEQTVDGVDVDYLITNTAFVQLSWTIATGGNGEEGAGEESGDPSDNEASEESGNGPAAADFAYELQRADNPNFEGSSTLYEGRDRASFQPGLAEGDYFYRVRAIDESGETGEWSRPLHVNVEYQSMTLAVSLFALGGFVFLATFVLVVAGTIADRKESEADES